MSKFIDLTGQRFGGLVVIKKINTSRWQCVCDCGNIVEEFSSYLTNGRHRSCGCHNVKSLVGKRFGYLTVEERVSSYVSPNGTKTVRWKCLCDCGNPKDVNGNSLKSGSTISCGCMKNADRKLPLGEASFNILFSSYLHSSRIRNIPFLLTKDFFRHTVSKRCYYCGSPPMQRKAGKTTNGIFLYNGLDRMDSSKGYTTDNVVPCCGRCNEAKMSENQKDFLDWVERVYSYSIKNKE